jgi:triphosphoribosyl-dephospho-CoA synthase
MALHDEVDLTPKPGLVDRRGPGAHTDMTVDMLHSSADALHTAFAECANAATDLALGSQLRSRIGAIGRAGECAMLAATGGVNTHRGALWALGLLSAAAGSGATTTQDAVAYAAQLARIPDPASYANAVACSHGARARRRYRVAGAPGEAQAGFPHVIRYALPTLHSRRPVEADQTEARLDALLSLIAHLDDTCLLHRGGAIGLAVVQSAAGAVLDAGGMRTSAGRQRFSELDRLCATRQLSPGGAGDLLAAALFLDTLERRRLPACRP